MTTCTLELKFKECCKWLIYYLQFAMNKLSIETQLFIILFKLAQLVKFGLDLGKAPLLAMRETQK